jgi:hypothetical protein
MADDKDNLKKSGIEIIGSNLSKATDNPWAFLRWMDYLCSTADLNAENYIESLNNYILLNFELYAKEVKFLARWYFRQDKNFVTREELKDLGIREALIDIYINQGIIVQFDINLPKEEQLYTVSPLLHSLKLEE